MQIIYFLSFYIPLNYYWSTEFCYKLIIIYIEIFESINMKSHQIVLLSFLTLSISAAIISVSN